MRDDKEILLVVGSFVVLATISIFFLGNQIEQIKKFTHVLSSNVLNALTILAVIILMMYMVRVNHMKIEDTREKSKDIDMSDMNNFSRVVSIEGFCNLDDIVEKDKKCRALLSKKNCTSTSCCVLLDGDKCVGGSSAGPTYLSLEGKNVEFDYYNFKDKNGSVSCRGNCPK
tara:strand:+ start:328 stop:840 length:513 start_codon:yes stop_codon:yes gene_type:complete